MSWLLTVHHEPLLHFQVHWFRFMTQDKRGFELKISMWKFYASSCLTKLDPRKWSAFSRPLRSFCGTLDLYMDACQLVQGQNFSIVFTISRHSEGQFVVISQPLWFVAATTATDIQKTTNVRFKTIASIGYCAVPLCKQRVFKVYRESCSSSHWLTLNVQLETWLCHFTSLLLGRKFQAGWLQNSVELTVQFDNYQRDILTSSCIYERWLCWPTSFWNHHDSGIKVILVYISDWLVLMTDNWHFEHRKAVCLRIAKEFQLFFQPLGWCKFEVWHWRKSMMPQATAIII